MSAMGSPSFRVFMLALGTAMMVFGIVIGIASRSHSPSPIERRLRYTPIWKQRSLFASPKEYQRHLLASSSIALGSLLVGIVMILDLL